MKFGKWATIGIVSSVLIQFFYVLGNDSLDGLADFCRHAEDCAISVFLIDPWKVLFIYNIWTWGIITIVPAIIIACVGILLERLFSKGNKI